MKAKNAANFNAYALWVGKCVINGTPLAAYRCPHCQTKLQTSLPCVGEVTDSLTTCAVCDELFFKVVDSTGRETVVTTSIKPMIA